MSLDEKTYSLKTISNSYIYIYAYFGFFEISIANTEGIYRYVYYNPDVISKDEYNSMIENQTKNTIFINEELKDKYFINIQADFSDKEILVNNQSATSADLLWQDVFPKQSNILLRASKHDNTIPLHHQNHIETNTFTLREVDKNLNKTHRFINLHRDVITTKEGTKTLVVNISDIESGYVKAQMENPEVFKIQDLKSDPDKVYYAFTININLL